MALSNEELIEELSNKSIIEVVDLVKALEEKWGVSAAAPVAAAAPSSAGGEAGAAEEKTEFTVTMKAFGDNKVAAVEAGAHGTLDYTIKEGVNKEESEEIKKQLEEAGATVEIT